MSGAGRARGATEWSGGRILVVDSDYDILDLLATALRARGHHVSLATDGRTGLQSAVEISAEVIVVDREVRVLDVRTFLDVLRDNPRTSGAHMFVMGTGDPAHLSAIHGRAEPIVKPFNAEEIASRIDEIIRSRKAPVREPDLRGDLSQVSLFDLLQVFALNRRTGRLVVEGAETSGEIWLARGEIVDAAQGYTAGEKAFYRILAVRSGTFLFVPDVEHGDRRIHAGVDQLLMEAARRVDEIARLRRELPPATAAVAIAPGRSYARATSRVGDAVLARADEPRTIDEILDLAPDHDVEILEAVRELLARGVLVVAAAQAKVRFCDPEEATSLRAAMLRQRRPGIEGGIRLGVVAPSGEGARDFARAMAAVREFVPAIVAPTSAGGSAFGAIGVVRLGGTELELFALPPDPSMRPLWGMALAGASAVLLLGEAETPRDVDELLRALDVRAVLVPAEYDEPEAAVAAIRVALAGGGGYAGSR